MTGRPCVDIIGKRFSRLVVIGKTSKRSQRTMVWLCHCDCGKETSVSTGHLQSGHTTSCGCYRDENRKKHSSLRIKHGYAKRGQESKEYKTWTSMKERCMNPKNEDYKNYGGRGIKVFESWIHSFENFLAYLKANNMYPKPAGMSIDRINNDGNYEPGNIRWATPKQQICNQRPKQKEIK